MSCGDRESERDAIGRLNRRFVLDTDKGDHGTRQPLEGILKGEEEHADWLETQLELIRQRLARTSRVEFRGRVVLALDGLGPPHRFLPVTPADAGRRRERTSIGAHTQRSRAGRPRPPRRKSR